MPGRMFWITALSACASGCGVVDPIIVHRYEQIPLGALAERRDLQVFVKRLGPKSDPDKLVAVDITLADAAWRIYCGSRPDTVYVKEGDQVISDQQVEPVVLYENVGTGKSSEFDRAWSH